MQKIKIKPCSQNLKIVNDKPYVVKIGRFGQLLSKLDCKKLRTYAKICNIGNLVMHIPKIVYSMILSCGRG